MSKDFPEQFRLLIHELLEHHLEMIEDCFDRDDVSYHVERILWANAYLKKYSVHVPVNPVDDISM
jgi:hypothetical protein